jgi:rubrerythrin
MILHRQRVDSANILDEALARLLGLSHLYHRQLLTVKNQKVKEILQRLAREKDQHAKTLEAALLKLGRDASKVRIPPDHPVDIPRELIPRIYQQEQELYLWYREQINSTRDGQLRTLLESLLEDEDRHLQALKDLYREITHC